MNYTISRCEDIAKHIDQIKKEHPYIKGKLFPADHVFDEDQSVKWNRIEVQRWNDKTREEGRVRQESINHKKELLRKDIIHYIYEYLDKKWSHDRCEVLFDKLYSEFEWSLYEGRLDTILDVISAALEIS